MKIPIENKIRVEYKIPMEKIKTLTIKTEIKMLTNSAIPPGICVSFR